MNETVYSWGRHLASTSQIVRLNWRSELPDFDSKSSFLPLGAARSYGDCCLNDSGTLISTRGLNRFLSFDRATGVLRCESGITLREVLGLAVPNGWFIPVSPGTQWVTIGGAIANDVHGKNHHNSGSFGCWVDEIELLRSDNGIKTCSATQNEGLFRATIGGLGLTGVILTATIRLKPISSSNIICRNFGFRDIEEYLALSSELADKFEYTVAWADCASGGELFKRGVFMCGNHAKVDNILKSKIRRNRSIPAGMASIGLCRPTVKVFNWLYHRVKCRSEEFLSQFEPFFYPLDVIDNWNRLYGQKGFFQLQCVIPDGSALKKFLEEVRRSGLASYLAVFKEFGGKPSPGLLSFPRPGHTLCFDFPNHGSATTHSLARLNSAVIDLGGALYPAKDATMNAVEFIASFPQLSEFKNWRDPLFSSSFWRRVDQSR